MIKKMIKKTINYFAVNDERLSLEHRLLLSTLIIGTIMGLVSALLNLLLTNSLIAALVPLLLAIVASILYYFARFKKASNTIAVITAIGGILGISFTWIFNGGINGPVFMFAFTFIILGLIIVPNKVKYYIIALFISVNLFILLIQLYRPDIIVSYPTEFSRWLDNLIGMLLSSIFVFLITRFVHKHYTIEKQRAEESNRLKSAFLANMSHEIRTPMNGILGFAELLKQPDLTSDQQQEYIGIIEKGGSRMLNIINDIVSISKIESGTMEVSNKESNINEQIEYIYTFFKPEAEAKRMKLSIVDTLTVKEVIIKTDRDKVFAILTNLVKNAIKYSKEGEIKMGYIVKGDYIEFYVKDTGIGIPKDRQKAIFERFIQADIEDIVARQGAGLGLSISKAYVEMLGGEIWVESEEGIGSTFYFTLPYNSEPEEKIVADNIVLVQEEKIQIKKLKILIVEDDETSEKLVSTYIKDFCKLPLKAKTGDEVVNICRNNHEIDLILMDIQIPNLNGYEVASQIRQFNKDVVIIAQTAYGLSGEREKAIEAGCNDYIAKPIHKTELLALIQKYFNN